jgi:hypothetical protein
MCPRDVPDAPVPRNAVYGSIARPGGSDAVEDHAGGGVAERL